ncbi:type 1 periplasmic-binding domain-containing protein [Sphingobacterium bovistauri]|uniref:ABC-type branched-chain amino acid transport system, substrate-binding protein n=1 Tax=Sphingobacterium bovistauri TaxID=2781959 RepID=A0ABS7Z401_9SPHI|nr:hypothetical protein [Sphingobacterium bovistauri]MCA5004880.1 hypothetical protein [Sphingobacterium bovistauri]
MLKESTELYMTSVQNHLQQLSGNNSLKKFYLIYAVSLLLGVSACAPKSSVLRAPSHTGQVSSKESKESKIAAEKVAAEKEALAKQKELEVGRSLSLLLPFKLDLISDKVVNEADVKRSALALDFYQGFELGLEEVSKNSTPFNLKVIDSKDNAYFNSTLASSEQIENSGLIIGPIYPLEIKSFGTNLTNKDKLVINPLAASPASEFGLNNLVTITPSIKSHTNGLAKRIAMEYITGDVIIIYNTSDNDSRQFLNGMLGAIKENKSNVNIISVSSLSQLNEKLSSTGSNLIVSGTTDKTQLNSMINNLSKKNIESGVSIKLYGHPLWDRFDFSNHPNFYSLQPVITTESSFKSWSSKAKIFKDSYRQKFGISPSEQSYKGYDVAVYFGTLINKYGIDNLKSKLESESFIGIYNTYNFVYNDSWGFTNESVSYKEYMHGGFQLQ